MNVSEAAGIPSKISEKHFERIFNAVTATQVVHQRFLKPGTARRTAVPIRYTMGIHEDSSMALSPLSLKKCTFRDARLALSRCDCMRWMMMPSVRNARTRNAGLLRPGRVWRHLIVRVKLGHSWSNWGLATLFQG